MDNQRENIEPYLLDRLDKENMQEFERAMDADSQLAQEVEQMRCIITSFERQGESRAFNALSRLNSEEELRDIMTRAEKGCSRRGRSVYLWSASVAAAAAATVLILIGIQPKYSSETLYRTYFTAHQQFETTPSRGGSVLSVEQLEMLSTATELYHQDDYSAAVHIYAKALNGIDANDIPEDAYLYYAISLMQTDNMDKATDILRAISGDDEAELQHQAQWNLALALLKTDQRNDAATIIDELISRSGTYATQAEDLKIKINKRKWF